MQIGDTVKIRAKKDGSRLCWDQAGEEMEGVITHVFSETYWVKVGTQTIKKVPQGTIPTDTKESEPNPTNQELVRNTDELKSEPEAVIEELDTGATITTIADRDNPIPPTSREVKLWRLLCEDLNRRPGKSAYNSALGYNSHPAWELFGNSRHAQQRRQALWRTHKIQLIFWQPPYGWRLRKNWQKKLALLEKTYLKEEGQLELELSKKKPGKETPGKYQGENSPLIIATARPPPVGT